MPITKIYNISSKLSYFPKDYKVAKLKSLYKKGTKTDPKNFWPISKIIGKEIHDQAMNYFT